MSVPVVPGRRWKAQAPVRVIDPDVLREVSISLRTYDVSPDGQRFLVIKDVPRENASASPPQVIVVQNWVEEWETSRTALKFRTWQNVTQSIGCFRLP